MRNLKQVAKYIIDNKGISFNPNLIDAKGNYLVPKSGYMVSDKGSELITSIEDVKPLLKSYIFKYAYNLKKDKYFGLWIDKEICIFDISTNIQDLKTAIIQGMENNQEAIYNIDNKKTIYIPTNQIGTNYQKKEYRKMKAEMYVKIGSFYQS